MRALRSCSGDVHVARVVVSLVVHAVVGLTLGLIAHVVVVVFVVAIFHRIFLYGRYTLYSSRINSPCSHTRGDKLHYFAQVGCDLRSDLDVGPFVVCTTEGSGEHFIAEVTCVTREANAQ